MIIGTIVVLVFLIITLMIYNINIHKKVQNYSNINQRINSLNVLQDFMDTIGDDLSVDDKIRKINQILIEKYEIKYSTIVVFDGAEYVIKASNVSEKHWDTLKSLQDEPIFKDSITSTNPKYITVDSEGERLPYQKMEFGRAKSAMFFPLYIDNVYIGYWIIESSVPHDFDKIDTTILEVVRENIVSVLKTVMHQKTLESLVRKDLFTGLQSAEYLYGEGKKRIDRYTISAMCMFKVINIEDINENHSRKMGNRVITEVAKSVLESISKEYILVRYMGPKFLIVFCGVNSDSVADFLNDLKNRLEEKLIYLDENYVPDSEDEEAESENQESVLPKLNFVVSTYYKGTGIEEVNKKLEEYLDNADKNESDINYI